MDGTVLLSFKNYGQPELILFTDNVILQTTTNPKFVSLKPLVDPVIERQETFRTAFNVSKTGGPSTTTFKDEKHKELLVDLEELANAVNKLAKGNRSVIAESGFKASTEPQSLNELATPQNFKALNLERNCFVKLTWEKVEKRTSYTVEMRIVGETEWKTVALPTATNYTFTDLTRGLHVEFRVRANGTRNIVSDWTPIRDVFVD
jgi:hypothetical protein